MKRKGILVGLVVLYLGIFVSCSDESEILSDKTILSEALTKGSWEVGLQHSLTRNIFDHSAIQLTFTEDGKVVAHSLESTSVLNSLDGSYILIYDNDETIVPDIDDPEYDYLDRQRDREEDLFLSLAFGMQELIILNHRWKVKDYTSTSVVLQANDIRLTLSKVDSE